MFSTIQHCFWVLHQPEPLHPHSSGSFELCELVNEILSAGAYEPWVQDLVAPAQVIRNSLDVCMFHPMFKQRPHFNTVYTLMVVMQCIPWHLCCFIWNSLGRWKCKSQYTPPLSSVLILKLFLCPVLARPTEPHQLCAWVALPRNCQQWGRGQGIPLQVGFLCVFYCVLCHVQNNTQLDWITGKEWSSLTTLWWWDGKQKPQLFRQKAGFSFGINFKIFTMLLFSPIKITKIYDLQPFWLLCTWSNRGCPISTRNSALPRGLHRWFFTYLMNPLSITLSKHDMFFLHNISYNFGQKSIQSNIQSTATQISLLIINLQVWGLWMKLESSLFIWSQVVIWPSTTTGLQKILSHSWFKCSKDLVCQRGRNQHPIMNTLINIFEAILYSSKSSEWDISNLEKGANFSEVVVKAAVCTWLWSFTCLVPANQLLLSPWLTHSFHYLMAEEGHLWSVMTWIQFVPCWVKPDLASMSLFLALHIGLVVGLDGSLPDQINPPPLPHAPKCRLSKMEESMSRFFCFCSNCE